MLAVQEQVVDFFEVNEKAGMVLNMIQSLVNSREDFVEVLQESFTERENRAFFVLNSIHRKRLENSSLTKTEFVNLFNLDRKEALEKLFITKLLQWHVDKLEDYPLTPAQIYDLHKADLNKPFLVLLMDSKFNDIQESKEGAATRHKWDAPNGKYTVSANIYPDESVASVFIRVKGNRTKLNFNYLCEADKKKLPKYVIQQCEEFKGKLERR
ncbi:hypothetical protein [Bacillus norwichensis]|uniref:Uncharacterized protein n=1 Tax=Bacillus norwichensis TaxID=2762217 RepID=A0ABR8VII0_9BACI|nr:hypothetical protein [Bacillus norwichensis]MBD8004560.1 hypothetical protein [Bacillus norwichensis]